MNKLPRHVALAAAARILVREIADVRGFVLLLRDSGAVRLADAVQRELAHVRARAVGGQARPDPEIWKKG